MTGWFGSTRLFVSSLVQLRTRRVLTRQNKTPHLQPPPHPTEGLSFTVDLEGD